MDGLNYLNCHLLMPRRFPLPERIRLGPDYGFAGFRYLLNEPGFFLIPRLGTTTITSMVTALVVSLGLWWGRSGRWTIKVNELARPYLDRAGLDRPAGGLHRLELLQSHSRVRKRHD